MTLTMSDIDKMMNEYIEEFDIQPKFLIIPAREWREQRERLMKGMAGPPTSTTPTTGVHTDKLLGMEVIPDDDIQKPYLTTKLAPRLPLITPLVSDIETTTFTVAYLFAEQRISPEIAKSAIIDIQEDIMGYLVVSIRAKVFTQELQKDCKVFKVRYPETWWEHFKERFFSDKLKKKYPVRYKEIKEKWIFKRNAMYPRLNQMLAHDEQYYYTIHETLRREGDE